MTNIKVTIEGVEKEYRYIAFGNPEIDVLLNGNWYKEVEPVKQGYEILSFKNNNGNYWKRYGTGDIFLCNGYSESLSAIIDFMPDLDTTIHSVKRLSDGEVFTVGDNIKDMGVITSFVLTLNSNIKVYSNERMEYYEDIEKVVTPTILLTTEDGKIVTNPDAELFVCYKKFNINTISASQLSRNQYNKYFSTEAAREEYIFQNKPITVSYNEFINTVDKVWMNDTDKAIIRRIFKQFQTK